MRRFQEDIPLMVRRWRQEWAKHGRDFGKCHCGAGMGTMRKHRVYESHAPGKCHLCAWERADELLERRRERYQARSVINEELRGLQRGAAGPCQGTVDGFNSRSPLQILARPTDTVADLLNRQ
jgi:hypothetical protein